MMIGKRYQDTLDPSHVVVPLPTGTCRHYHDGVYSGQAPVPAGLFANDTRDRVAYYGFVLESQLQARDDEADDRRV